jgi:hypothetical protein
MKTAIIGMTMALLLGLALVGCSHAQMIQPGSPASTDGAHGQATPPDNITSAGSSRQAQNRPKNPLITEHVNYSLMLLTTGTNFFWKETGRLPESLTELSQHGLIPANLANPVTGKPFQAAPQIQGIGDFTYSKQNEQRAVFSYVMADNTTIDGPVDASKFTGLQTAPDSRVALYLQWAHIGLRCYYKDFEVLPTGINDLVKAGYWPFSVETNPVTGEKMDFVTQSRGSIFLKFEQSRVTIGSLNSNNGRSQFYLDSTLEPPGVYDF